MKFICTSPGCGKLIPKRGRCDVCKLDKGRAERVHREERSDIRQLYFTARWNAVRKQVIMRDKGLCRQCVKEGRTVVGDQVDHVLPAIRYPELFFTSANLQTLCASCHSKKTFTNA